MKFGCSRAHQIDGNLIRRSKITDKHLNNKTVGTYSVRSEAFDIHFLGLCLEGCLMGDNRLDNLGVEVDNDGHWHGIVQDESIQNVALVVPVLSKVVIAAGHQ